MTRAAIVRSSSMVAVFAVILVVLPEPIAMQDRDDGARGKTARAELWMNPGDLRQRDAFHGPGGRDLVPAAEGVFDVVDVDNTGYSGGYTVTDEHGRKWDVKIGPEAQPEVVVSRVLWLIGYHQPVMHFMTRWKRKGEEDREQLSGRFRLQSDHDTDGEWAWRDNPFVGTRELNGLVVANLLLNNWDFKNSNNRIYTLERVRGGPRRWFVVQDLGASLGRTGWPMGTRNDVEGFEEQRFVSVKDGALTFDYSGRHREVFEAVTPPDVVWVCRLLGRITERQWEDVFRAAAYPRDVAARYRHHIAAKIAEGLALEPARSVKP